MRIGKPVVLIPLMAILFCTLLSPAWAEVSLVQSTPVADSSVAAPKVIRLTFSEKIAPATSGFQLSMGDGMGVSTAATLSDDGKTLMGRPTSPFMSGKWTLSWHAIAAGDGHRAQGSYSFVVH
jgi:hypothetical protein